jgi:hypothetical protein
VRGNWSSSVPNSFHTEELYRNTVHSAAWNEAEPDMAEEVASRQAVQPVGLQNWQEDLTDRCQGLLRSTHLRRQFRGAEERGRLPEGGAAPAQMLALRHGQSKAGRWWTKAVGLSTISRGVSSWMQSLCPCKETPEQGASQTGRPPQ